MPDSVAVPTKRKKPPTFHHFPVNRAKVLKKAWVEKAKIKSKWKTEKRKEGLVASSKLDIPTYSDEEGVNDDEKDISKADLEPSRPTSQEFKHQRSYIHPSRAHLHPDSLAKRSKSNPEPQARPTKKQKILKGKEPEIAPEVTQPASVRDLTREAYSRATLHTYKSDPLKKRQFRSERGGKDGNAGRGQPQIGRGQPNMKLRMNAMLAKIKQDYAS